MKPISITLQYHVLIILLGSILTYNMEKVLAKYLHTCFIFIHLNLWNNVELFKHVSPLQVIVYMGNWKDNWCYIKRYQTDHSARLVTLIDFKCFEKGSEFQFLGWNMKILKRKSKASKFP